MLILAETELSASYHLEYCYEHGFIYECTMKNNVPIKCKIWDKYPMDIYRAIFTLRIRLNPRYSWLNDPYRKLLID